MNDPHPGVFGRSVADGRGFAAELGMLEPRNAAKRRPRRLRLQVSDRDPISRRQPLAQIAMAGALADLIFDDAQDAPQQEMRGVDPRGSARHRLAASPELGDRVAFRPQQPQPIGIAVRASRGVVMRHGWQSRASWLPGQRCSATTRGHLTGAHLTSSTSGFPFSTIYVASSAPLPVPTFLAAWIVPAGMNKTSPALSVTDGLPSTSYSSEPSIT